MQAFLVSLGSVFVAELGDRTQLLALLLAARFKRPWAVLAGVLCATLANHAVAGLLGVWFGRFLRPPLLDALVGVSLIVMALWSLKPEKEHAAHGEVSNASAFIATLVGFFLAEIGDKTQIATMALAAAYHSLVSVVAGTTAGMLLANAPTIFIGSAFSGRLPLRTLRYTAAVVFFVLGVVFVLRAWR
jgi:putative Ca2+/H+ antiporter (TMEM165/GDT1 family)